MPCVTTAPKASVIVAFHDAGERMADCARALFGQTQREGLEFVFVDDGSTDGSAAAVEKVLGEFPWRKGQVRFERLAENSGVAAARLKGFAAATGEYVISCDSDDEPEPALYETMLAAAAENSADAVVSPATVVWPGGEARVDDVYDDAPSFFRGAFHTTYFNALWNKLFRRELFAGGLALPAGRMDLSEDLLIVAQTLPRCRRIVFSRGASYRYRMSDSSVCGRWSRKSVEDQIETAGLLEGALPPEYRWCVRHLRHRIQSNVLTRGGLDAREYAGLWPDERSIASLASDRRLRAGTAAAIWLSGFAPAAAMAAFRAGARLRARIRGRIRDV